MLISLNSANAQAVDGFYLGDGASTGGSCGHWAYQRGLKRSPADPRDAYEYWVMGYATGIAVALKNNALAQTGGALRFFQLVDNYCYANRNVPLEEAVDQVMLSLMGARSR